MSALEISKNLFECLDVSEIVKRVYYETQPNYSDLDRIAWVKLDYEI